MDPLITSLLDFVQELGDEGSQITVGGGFGLFLKRKHLLSEGKEMLFRQLPEPRSTNDLDLFVRTEILVDYQRTLAIAETIKRLGYQVVDEAKFLQWRKSILVAGVEQEVEIQ